MGWVAVVLRGRRHAHSVPRRQRHVVRPLRLLVVWLHVRRRLHLVLLLELRRRRLVLLLLLLLLAGGSATQHLSLQLLSRHRTLQQQWQGGAIMGTWKWQAGETQTHIAGHCSSAEESRAGKAGSLPTAAHRSHRAAQHAAAARQSRHHRRCTCLPHDVAAILQRRRLLLVLLVLLVRLRGGHAAGAKASERAAAGGGGAKG